MKHRAGPARSSVGYLQLTHSVGDNEVGDDGFRGHSVTLVFAVLFCFMSCFFIFLGKSGS